MDIECHREYWTAFQQGVLRPIVSEGESRYSAVTGLSAMRSRQDKEAESIFNRTSLYRWAILNGITGYLLAQIKRGAISRVVANRRHEIAVERACRSIDVPRETSLCYPEIRSELYNRFNGKSLI